LDDYAPWAGVDVGGGRKGLHAAVVLSHGDVELASGSVADIVGWLAERTPTLVAVDSPRSLARAGKRSRECERQFAQAQVCGIRYTPDEEGLTGNRVFYEWIAHGRELYDALDRIGLPAIECFPTASWTRWFGKRGSTRRAAWTRDALHRTSVMLPRSRLNQDERDAIGAALTARSHLLGRTEMFGDIVVPLAGWAI
jgi:predicted nuclease with RNAse H fold